MNPILIIICLAIYYISGWIAFNILLKRYEIQIEPAFYVLITIFGLGIITILRLSYLVIVDLIKHHNKKNTIIIVKNSKLPQNGIQKYGDKLIYNFADEKYYGYLDIDASGLNYKEIDKIIVKLNAWANDEKMIQARLNAIKEFNR